MEIVTIWWPSITCCLGQLLTAGEDRRPALTVCLPTFFLSIGPQHCSCSSGMEFQLTGIDHLILQKATSQTSRSAEYLTVRAVISLRPCPLLRSRRVVYGHWRDRLLCGKFGHEFYSRKVSKCYIYWLVPFTGNKSRYFTPIFYHGRYCFITMGYICCWNIGYRMKMLSFLRTISNKSTVRRIKSHTYHMTITKDIPQQ